MIDLSKKRALIYDLSGSYTFIAERLARDFGWVGYHSSWELGFSNVQDFLPGVGLEDVERVIDPFDHLDNCDLIVFPDVGLDGLQQYLRREGLAVWGSGAAGALERDRFLLKEKLEGQDMDVAEYEIVTGLPALRKYLADAEPCWVKVSYFRGLSETHEHKSAFQSQAWLDDLAVKLGPYQYKVLFLVEQPIDGDAEEPGVDIYAVNGEVPELWQWGYENKDKGYLGVAGAQVPERLKACTAKFLPVLREYDYRGPLSTEVRVTKDRDFLIDLTGRFPSPPSEAQCLNTKNISEIMYQGARGILVEPAYRYRYVAQFVLRSDVLESQPLGVEVGEPEMVPLHGHCRVDGKDYIVSPQKIHEFAGAVGLADELDEACERAFDAAESVSGDGVEFSRDALKETLDKIEAGQKLGLDWGEFE